MEQAFGTQPWEYVRGLQPTSFCDWPGRVCAVIFLGGCNLRCPTCHNAKVAWSPENLPQLDKNEILSLLLRRKDWLDGIVLTGGEPTCVPHLDQLLIEIKEVVGLPLKVDSNGLKPEVLGHILQEQLVEMLAVDVKGPWEKYPLLTGQACSAQEAEATFMDVWELVSAWPDFFYFRCTQVPQLNEADLDIVRGYLPAGFKLNIQKYVEPAKER
jgi:pyruvate formate lyase activating enzyme